MKNMPAIDDELFDRAQKASGLRQKSAVVNAALRALIARENARRLIALSGSDPIVKPVTRRRSRSLRQINVR